MLSDVFSIFDFGGSYGWTGFLSWVMSVSAFFLAGMVGDLWMVGSYSSILLVKSPTTLAEKLSFNMSVVGLSSGLSGIFIYLCFTGWFLSFPLSFSPLWHFSHNLMVSVVVWISLMLVEACMSGYWFFSRFSVPGLHWLPGVLFSAMEAISYGLRALTLGARLTMNLMAGKLMLVLGCSALSGALSSLKIISVAVIGSALLTLVFWELVSVFVQGLIFVTLVSDYSKEGFQN
nr:ATP6 [Donax trunculus]